MTIVRSHVRTSALVATALSTLVLASCEKAGPKASGELTKSEAELLAHLPHDSALAFGGNFMRLQQTFARGPLGRMLGQLDAVAPGLKEWTECFAGHEAMTMVGAVDFEGGMRFIMKGISVDDLANCAKRAGYASNVDPDRKFIAITMGEPVPQTLGYLVLPDGAVYGKQDMKAAFGRADRDAFSRPRLEADIAAVAKSNAAGNAELKAVIAKADRTRSMWFAGSAAGSSFGDKLGEAFGSLDLADGLRADIVVEVKDSRLARQVVDGLDDARKAAGMLSPELKSVLDAIDITRSGDRLRIVAKLSSRQFEALMNASRRFGGGL
jgi:hypothetical protein